MTIDNNYFSNGLISLPRETAVEIGRFSNFKSLLALSATSKEWNKLINEVFQKKMLYGFSLSKIIPTGNSYKKIYDLIIIAVDQAEIKDVIREVRKIIALAEKQYLYDRDENPEIYNIHKETIGRNRVRTATALLKAGETKEANELFILSKDVALPKGLPVLIEAAIGLEKIGNTEKANEFFTLSKDTALSIEDNFDKSLALEVVIGLAKAGNTKEANEVVTLLKDTAPSIEDDFDKTALLTQIAEAQIQVGDIKGAKSTILLINDFYTTPELVSRVALSLAQAGDTEGAKVMYRSGEINSFDYNEVEKLNKIVLSLAGARDTEGVNEFFTLLKKAVPSLKNERFVQPILLVKLATDLAKAGNSVFGADERANEFFALSKDVALSIGINYFQALALIELATVLAEAGNMDEANELFIESSNIVYPMESGNSKTSALTKLATALAKTGNIEDAKGILISFKEVAFLIDNHLDRSSTLAQIAIALAEIGNTKEANEVITLLKEEVFLIEKKRVKSAVLSKIAEAQTKILITLAKSGNIVGVKECIGNMRGILSDADIGFATLQAAREIKVTTTTS